MTWMPREEFFAQQRERWGALNVEYHPYTESDPTVRRSDMFEQTPTRERIPHDEVLHTHQSHASIEEDHLPVAARSTDPITVVHLNGRKYVFDGHHRLVTRRSNQESIDADVYYNPPLQESNP